MLILAFLLFYLLETQEIFIEDYPEDKVCPSTFQRLVVKLPPPNLAFPTFRGSNSCFLCSVFTTTSQRSWNSVQLLGGCDLWAFVGVPRRLSNPQPYPISLRLLVQRRASDVTVMTSPLTELGIVNSHDIPWKNIRLEIGVLRKSCSHECGTQKDREGVLFSFF